MTIPDQNTHPTLQPMSNFDPVHHCERLKAVRRLLPSGDFSQAAQRKLDAAETLLLRVESLIREASQA